MAEHESVIFGYARVSTGDQVPSLQVDRLHAAGCHQVLIDQASGGLRSRPALDKLLEQLRSGDQLVVWKLDRLGRGLKHLVELMEALRLRGVEFRSLTEAIDTTTAAGRMFFHIMAAVAEFERDLNRERTRAGMAAARARGRFGGRPRVVTPENAQRARDLYDANELSLREIGKLLKPPASERSVVRMVAATRPML